MPKIFNFDILNKDKFIVGALVKNNIESPQRNIDIAKRVFSFDKSNKYSIFKHHVEAHPVVCVKKEGFYFGISVTHAPITRCFTDIVIEKKPKWSGTINLYKNTFMQNTLLKIPENKIKVIDSYDPWESTQELNQVITKAEIKNDIKFLMVELVKGNNIIDFRIYLNFNDYILSVMSYHLLGKLSEDGLIAFWILLNKLNYIGMGSELWGIESLDQLKVTKEDKVILSSIFKQSIDEL
jgi:hypothetical protein